MLQDSDEENVFLPYMKKRTNREYYESLNLHQRYLLDTLRSVGIKNDIRAHREFRSGPRLLRHLSTVPDFYYEGEPCSFEVPEIGASKLSRKIFDEIILRKDEVEIREKIDGYEVITFNVVAFDTVRSFMWTTKKIKEIDYCRPSVYEEVGSDMYHVSGDNSYKCHEHKWTSPSLEDVKNYKEGMVIRYHGREYRVPRLLTATFEVKDELPYLGDYRIKNAISNGLANGFYDFTKESNIWRMVKHRPDKYCSDSQISVKKMLEEAVDFNMFIDKYKFRPTNLSDKVECVLAPMDKDKIYIFDNTLTIRVDKCPVGSVKDRIFLDQERPRSDIVLRDESTFEVSGLPVVVDRYPGYDISFDLEGLTKGEDIVNSDNDSTSSEENFGGRIRPVSDFLFCHPSKKRPSSIYLSFDFNFSIMKGIRFRSFVFINNKPYYRFYVTRRIKKMLVNGYNKRARYKFTLTSYRKCGSNVEDPPFDDLSPINEERKFSCLKYYECQFHCNGPGTLMDYDEKN